MGIPRRQVDLRCRRCLAERAVWAPRHPCTVQCPSHYVGAGPRVAVGDALQFANRRRRVSEPEGCFTTWLVRASECSERSGSGHVQGDPMLWLSLEAGRCEPRGALSRALRLARPMADAGRLGTCCGGRTAGSGAGSIRVFKEARASDGFRALAECRIGEQPTWGRWRSDAQPGASSALNASLVACCAALSHRRWCRISALELQVARMAGEKPPRAGVIAQRLVAAMMVRNASFATLLVHTSQRGEPSVHLRCRLSRPGRSLVMRSCRACSWSAVNEIPPRRWRWRRKWCATRPPARWTGTPVW